MVPRMVAQLPGREPSRPSTPSARSSTPPGLASVFLLGIESGTELGEAVSLNEVFGYFGIAAASALAPRVVARIVRDRQT